MSDTNTVKTQVWFDRDGNLVTNNTAAFAKEFHVPDTAPVDGLRRVSLNARKAKSQRQTKPR